MVLEMLGKDESINEQRNQENRKWRSYEEGQVKSPIQ
jgi:hypothetical protein